MCWGKFNRRSAAPKQMRMSTQGSQTLTLGLVLTAAPQLVVFEKPLAM